jgi:PhnB protein
MLLSSREKEITVASVLNPYLSFRAEARQAMEFYKSVFGGTLTVNTFGEFGSPEGADAEKIMHAQLETDNGYRLMASDTPAGMDHNPGTNITVSLSGDDAADLRAYWEKLSEGGTVTVPFEKQMWGDEFGSCIDKFGIPWMVNVVQQA